MSVATRTPKQRLNDYLYSQVEIVNQVGGNKRIHCKKCTHNFSGSITRIYEHLTGKAGDVKACSFSQTIVYVHYNTRCELKSRKPEEFPPWLDEDVQLLPV